MTDATYVLNEAKRRVYDRGETHGEPEDSFAQIARQWATWMDDDVTAFDVCIMMTQFKLARVKEGEATYESLLDAAGYIENAARLHVTDGADDVAAEADALTDTMTETETTDDTAVVNELELLQQHPNEWLSISEIMSLLDTDSDYWGHYDDPRAEVARMLRSAADNWDDIGERVTDEGVQYRYYPNRDQYTNTGVAADRDDGDGAGNGDASELYDTALAVLRDRPNEWVPATEVERLVDTDTVEYVRAGLADAAVNMECVQSLNRNEGVQYRYVPERDPTVNSDTASATDTDPPDEYGAACRDESPSSERTPFDPTG